METKGTFKDIAIFTNSSLQLTDSTIITSDDDEAVGTYCPCCNKTEITSMDISSEVKVVGEWAGAEQQQWSVNGCMCVACRLFWMLFVNPAGRRMLIYERKKGKAAGAY